jgi:hypothetical protein
MSEDDPYQPAVSTTELEVIRESPIELQPNPAIGVVLASILYAICVSSPS